MTVRVWIWCYATEIYELTSSHKLETTEGVSTALPLEKKTIKISLNSNLDEEEEKQRKCC